VACAVVCLIIVCLEDDGWMDGWVDGRSAPSFFGKKSSFKKKEQF
jgi:hypothetical protein